MNEQMNIFDYIRKPFSITNKIRLIELFGGIGSQAMALRNIGADFEHYRLCEWEAHAVDSYNAIHGTDFAPSDITKIKGEDLGIVETDKYTYILTYSFPCQDLSVAGLMRGAAEGSGTRSALLWEVKRLLLETKNLPQVLLMENVIQVHSPGANMANFQKWISFLNSLGYSSYWQDMNAKRYGMPQNRNRTIMVSILGEYNFKFPAEKPFKVSAYDLLEKEVDEKYYLDGEKCEFMVDELKANGTVPRQTDRQTGRRLLITQLTNQKSQTLSIASRPDTTRGLEREDKKELVFANMRFFRGENPMEVKQVDVASTILASKSKGTSNLGEDVVIEKKTNIDNGL